MPARLEQIWRYPIKAIGAERLVEVALMAGAPLPLDRAWAVLEEGADHRDGWMACRHFLRGAKGPSLMAITARSDGDLLHLSHPTQADLTITLGAADAAPALFDWLRPIYPSERRGPAALVKSPPIGMADADFASVSIMNLASLRALSAHMAEELLGAELDPRRFRGNLWLEGLPAWREFDLIGRRIQIGDAVLKIVEPITRCRATEANPDTGARDVNPLRALSDGWGHTDFGVYAVVETGGRIEASDAATVRIG